MPAPTPAFDPTQKFDVVGSKPTTAPGQAFDPNKPFDTVQAPGAKMSWSDVGGEALSNLLSSALATGKAMVQPILHPIDTAKALGSTVEGEGEKLGRFVSDKLGYGKKPPQDANEQTASALNSYFTNRYGSVEGFKQALAKDPVGVASDMSAAFTGGETALARAPGIVGKVGKIAGKIGEVTNTVGMAGKAVGAVGKGIAKVTPEIIGNLATHTGATPLRTAFQAGQKGGQAAQSFLDNMRGNAPMDTAVTSARDAVAQMRKDRNADYKAGMAGVGNDKTVLDFKPIDAELAKTNQVKTFKGEDLSKSTADVRKKVKEAIDYWKQKNPVEYHTPEGLDALKQMIGDIKNTLPVQEQYNTPQALVVDNAYNAVKSAIVKQAPHYADVMKNYEQASDLVKEVEKSLSLGKRASADTALRKLQSIMRNNVNANFGQRAALGAELAKHAPNLPYELAGQSLSAMTPRGLGGIQAGAEAAGALYSGHPGYLLAAPFTSPRLMGEAGYRLGQGAGAASSVARYVPPGSANLAPLLYEAGSANDIANALALP